MTGSSSYVGGDGAQERPGRRPGRGDGPRPRAASHGTTQGTGGAPEDHGFARNLSLSAAFP